MINQIKVGLKIAGAVAGALYVNGMQETIVDKIRYEKKEALKKQANKEFYIPAKQQKQAAATWQELFKNCAKEVGADVSNNIVIGGMKYAEHGVSQLQRETMDKNLGILYRKGGMAVEEGKAKLEKLKD